MTQTPPPAWHLHALQVLSLASMALAPIALLQGARVRRKVPDVGPAAGPNHGCCAGDQPTLRLLVVGESPVAGYGAPNHEQAITGSLATALAARSGRAVTWRALGADGVTAQRVHDELLPQLAPEPADVVVIALGVNDSVSLTPARRYADQLHRLVDALRARTQPGCIVLSGLPPIARFPSLPQPLACLLGLRGRVLDVVTQRLAPASGALYAPAPSQGGPEHFCADGFHPSPAGYALWAEMLAARVPL